MPIALGIILRGCPASLGIVFRRRPTSLRKQHGGYAVVAWHSLKPRILEDLDAKTLVVGVVAGKVAVTLLLNDRVMAGEEELLKLAHLGVYNGSVTVCGILRSVGWLCGC